MYTSATPIKWRMIDDKQIVLLDTKSGRYFTLNASASLVWNELMRQSSLENIADKIAKSCDVERDKVLNSVQEFVTHCMNEGVLTQADRVTPIEQVKTEISLQSYEPPAILIHESVQELTAGSPGYGHYWF